VSLADGRPVDARAAWAGRTLSDLPPPSPLLGPRPVPLGAGGAAGVAWWGPARLAVASPVGAVAVASLPGALNALGDGPAARAPGCRVAVADGWGAPGARGVLVAEPLAASEEPAAARRGGGWESPLLPGSPRRSGGRSSGSGRDSSFGDGGGGGGLVVWLAARLGVAEEFAAAKAAQRRGDRSSGGWPGWPATVKAAAARGAGWRLSVLAERTAGQMVEAHLRDHDWGRAMVLARAAGVHPDVVYKGR
jgi:hypothetical protein